MPADEKSQPFAFDPFDITYDGDGNLLSDGTWVYTWDAENRLVGMENTNDYYVATGKKQKLAFAYDETGRRVEKKVWSWNSGGWTLVTHHRFLYDGWNLMAQLDGNNENDVLKTFTWGQDITGSFEGAAGIGGLLDVQDYCLNGDPDSGGCSFYLYDGMGNIVGLTGYTGGYDAEYAYDPYGGTLYDNPIYSGVTQDNPFRFSTKYLDFETGLYYYGHRYYNPDQGRWISKDPIEEDGGLNLYAFVGNEPVEKLDLLGLITFNFDGNCSQQNRDVLNKVGETVEAALSRASNLFAGSNLVGNSHVDRIMQTWFVDRTDFSAYPFTVQVVRDVIGRINNIAKNNTIDIQCDGWSCDGNTLGYVLKFLGQYRFSIVICCKTLTMSDEKQIGRVLIHEMAHRYGQVEDYGYYVEPAGNWKGWYNDPKTGAIIENLSIIERLNNADTYAYMIIKEFFK